MSRVVLTGAAAAGFLGSRYGVTFRRRRVLPEPGRPLRRRFVALLRALRRGHKGFVSAWVAVSPWPGHLRLAKAEARSTVILDETGGVAWKVLETDPAANPQSRFSLERFRLERDILARMHDAGLGLSPPMVEAGEQVGDAGGAYLGTRILPGTVIPDPEQWAGSLPGLLRALTEWYRVAGIEAVSAAPELDRLERAVRDGLPRGPLQAVCQRLLAIAGAHVGSCLGERQLLLSRVHGDLAPRNSLLTDAGLKLIDWGDAKYTSIFYDLLSAELGLVRHRRHIRAAGPVDWTPGRPDNDAALFSQMGAGGGLHLVELAHAEGVTAPRLLELNLIVAVLVRALRRHAEGEDVFNSPRMRGLFRRCAA